MLTRKQNELLLYINDYLSKTGTSPSFDEMKDALGLKSKSGIHRLITGLEERGFIRRLPHRARALEVLRMPQTATAEGKTPARQSFAPNVIRGEFDRPLHGVRAGPDADTVQLPLYGRIAAGTPIEALRDPDTMVDVPSSMTGKGEHYALRVDGDSMVEAGIMDGDVVIIQRCDTAENGSIVVALIEDQEVTLKRLRRKGNSVALEPANQSYETRIFGPDQVRVQGRLIGLLRHF
ncbi:MAG: transcriptional repressor LexA [Alphaproteobacteria bacterium]|nr:transcriptional repressor LexA [Alphaproteobacteria bacterium]